MSDYAALLEYVHADEHRAALQYLADNPGTSQLSAAEALGIKRKTLSKWVERARKRRAASDPAAHAPKAPPGYRLRGVSSLLDAKGQVTQQWVKTAPDNADTVRTIEALREELAELDIPRLEPSSAPQHTMDDLCAVYPMGDAHLGARAYRHEVGEDFDLSIAKRNMLAAYQSLTAIAPPAGRAIVANMGDYFHADNANARTPKSGNLLDVDGRHELVLRTGFYAFRSVIQLALQKHGLVDVVICRGNHDPESSLVMKIITEALFENEPRVKVHTSSSYFDYLSHGDCLFGWHHGHGTKPQKMASVMAADVPQMWGRAKHRHVYLGHYHSQSVYEEPGCTMETVNTLAGKDSWHMENGYRSRRCAFVDTWHATDGQVSRQHWNLPAAK